MAAEITPSKQVSASPLQPRHDLAVMLTTRFFQAATAIESFKMESPVKKLNFGVADKENKPFDADLANLEAEIDAKHMETKVVKEEPKTAVAPTIKPEEADEPLLQENPQRFVLFPIKYHEVRSASCHFRRATRKVG